MIRLAPTNHTQSFKRNVIIQREHRDSVDSAKRWTFPTGMLFCRSIASANQLPTACR